MRLWLKEAFFCFAKTFFLQIFRHGFIIDLSTIDKSIVYHYSKGDAYDP